MKTFKLLLAAIVLLATTSAAHAQSDKSQRTIGIKTQNIKVLGTCDMDKRRIENSAYKIDGIKSAVWDLNTQTLTIKYSVFKKDAPDNAQKTIASLGNDTEKYKADDTAYMNLPECCHYRKS
ncbi:heavy-metal-associated domain-containing protein [Panacibacter ginsenosidivorans]|uniref:Heavy-metal-associated domain-containing protein n=1 Tax=Panacibacter ginsenosidivorans TaxID=1813871 RepID=A0A5B8VEG0_9BACT|nr:heavy metal-associated domain-containing protein [Panacibacter ginsenosidivorans]QEC69712.1 heavy-metal-associated domain-containing protein [Panacibacter ginsenosidivorans]